MSSSENESDNEIPEQEDGGEVKEEEGVDTLLIENKESTKVDR